MAYTEPFSDNGTRGLTVIDSMDYTDDGGTLLSSPATNGSVVGVGNMSLQGRCGAGGDGGEVEYVNPLDNTVIKAVFILLYGIVFVFAFVGESRTRDVMQICCSHVYTMLYDLVDTDLYKNNGMGFVFLFYTTRI